MDPDEATSVGQPNADQLDIPGVTERGMTVEQVRAWEDLRDAFPATSEAEAAELNATNAYIYGDEAAAAAPQGVERPEDFATVSEPSKPDIAEWPLVSSYQPVGSDLRTFSLAGSNKLPPSMLETMASDPKSYTVAAKDRKLYLINTPEGTESNIANIDASGNVTMYAGGKKKAEEPTALQSLYKSPQFMAPVVSSVLNGLAQSFIAERMAKAQRDEQRRMLDAQFQLANAKEEADMAERRRVSKRYWELKKKQGRA